MLDTPENNSTNALRNTKEMPVTKLLSLFDEMKTAFLPSWHSATEGGLAFLELESVAGILE
jgi:hypothetical protein